MKQQFAVRLLAAALINVSYLISATIIPANAQQQYAKPSDIPAEVFAALPQVSRLRQSPNGEKVAFLSSIEGRKVVVVQNLDGSDRYIQPPIDDADLYSFRWANDKRLLMMYELTIVRNEYWVSKRTETRLAAVNPDGSNMKWIVRPGKIKNGRGTHDNPMWQTDIIDMLPDDPDHILLALDADFNNQSEIRKVNINNGRFSELEDGFRGVQNWMTDASGEPRFGWGVWKENNIAYWKNANGDWVQVTNQDWYKEYSFFGFDETPNHMILYAPTPHGTQGVFRLNIETGKIVDEIFSHPDVNVNRLYRDEGVVVGVGYTTDESQVHYFDKKRAGLSRAMSKALKGYGITITDFDHDVGKYLLFAYNDREPGVYFQYDRKAKKLIQVTPTRPQIPIDLMAGTVEKAITARDGTTIPTFLTTPINVESKKLPAVILVHGGPYARDDASWDYWAQFLASRGYAVIKPNFRGSDGYGKAFLEAGYNQWGGLMQQDVADATKQLIDEGLLDPKRICIAGASYGGYSAMMGFIQTPDLYQCGISINGGVNIPRLKNADASFWGTKQWRSRMGLKDAKDEDVSPYHLADQINRPVLIMASKDDTRLKIVDSENFHDRLKSKGKDSQFIKIEDGGHGMDTAASRLTKLKAMEEFLAKHIGE